MQAPLYDVVVIGAGPGGSAAAYYNARLGRSVLLLDRANFPRDKTCGDGLTPRALHILDDMSVFAQAEQAGFRINGISVFAKRGATLQASVPQHHEFRNHLLVVPRFYLDDILRQRAVQQGAQFIGGAKVTRIIVHEDSIEVIADVDGQPSRYCAKVAIAAVGANIGFLREMGILEYAPRPIVAVRAYYEGLRSLGNHIQAHFEEVPMPGYGWVFPTGLDSANIGLGLWREQANASGSLRAALARFVASPRLRSLMEGASQVGAIKSYPLRIDFTTAPTFGKRVLLVGESAGLVSPLTGEGIDFALETGKMAAQFLQTRFASGDFSPKSLAGYDRMLRANFQSMFRFLGYLRKVYVNPLLMDRIIRLCEQSPEVRQLFVGILMSQQHPATLLKPRVLRKVLIGV